MSIKNEPFGLTTSAGHEDEVPEHVSCTSHFASFDGRHTCVDGANPHCAVQHGLLSGSHTAPFWNLHVWELQHGEVTSSPGSQSSPCSTMPLPHICRESVSILELGSCRQLVLVRDTPAISEPTWVM